MALTQATTLADYASGIGTQGATLTVDTANKRVGIGTTDPQATLQVGQNITADGLAGVITATSFEGSGSNLTGVSGFGTALSATQTDPGNLIYTTPRSTTVATASSLFIDLSANTSAGNVAFTRLAEIHVASGATMHVGSGTTLMMDVLGLYK